MNNTQEIIAALQAQDDILLSRILNDLVETHRKGDGKKARDLWKRYMLKETPIQLRKPASYEKIDRRVANDFYADIVDTKTGYMGNEVSTVLNKEGYDIESAEYDADRNALKLFQTMNYTEDLNSDQVRRAGATGVSYRILYVPEETNTVHIKNIPAWEVIYVKDQSLETPQLVLRYYTIEDVSFDEGGNKHTKERTVVEWYDDTEVTFFIDDGEGHYKVDRSKGNFIETEDGPFGTGKKPHLFNGIPVIQFVNNELETAEPEKVVDLIDAYDAIVSSTTSEIEQLRLAYMFIKDSGLMVDAHFMAQLEQTGIFPLSENGEVGFINKQLADAPVRNLLAEIRRNIYQFSKSIDMSKDFGGEMRVIGWQVALLNLENSAKITERKFRKALRKQYELITDYWRLYGFQFRDTTMPVDIDAYSIDFIFNRNFPRDTMAEAQTLQLLMNTVSTQTAYAQMSFIDDPETEIRKVEEERDPYRSVDANAEPTAEQPEDQ